MIEEKTSSVSNDEHRIAGWRIAGHAAGRCINPVAVRKIYASQVG